MVQIEVPLPGRAYTIHIGGGLLPRLGAFVTGKKVLVVTDFNVQKHGYLEIALRSLQNAGVKAESFTVQPGEESKSLYTYETLLNACAAYELSGGDQLIALGGGVIGDLTGFAAATYRRGIGFVQVPTTLLAAVDSSVGGKTGVNLAAGKNLAGAFWQPDCVLCDPDTHGTLPPAEYANGVAECLKYGVLWDEELFCTLAAGGRVTEEQIARCVALKRDVILRDERDTGERRLLNLGHTFGHAIEKVSAFTVPHGAAVAIGICLICRIFSENLTQQIAEACKANNLPIDCAYPADALLAAIAQDKKRAGDAITIVVPTVIGNCKLRTLSLDELRERLQKV